MFKRLKQEHEGAIGLEATIQAPLIYMSLIMLLYFFFTVMSYICYANIANSIAQDLNMRQTGYETAMLNYPAMPQVWSYRISTTDDNAIESGKYLNPGNVTGEPATQALMSGIYASLDKHKDGFIIPFTELTDIKVYTTKAIDPSLGVKLAGTVITVEIYYKSFMATFGDTSISMPTIKASGYNIIS